MTIPFGLSPFGFKPKRLIDVKTDLDNSTIAQFGDVNLDPQSVFGQQIGLYSKVGADYWENLEDVYYSQYPNSAEGVALDNVVQLNGITRLPAQRTAVTGVAEGLEGTLIPIGSLARIPDTGAVFFSNDNYIITRQRASNAIVQVAATAGQIYTLLINNSAYSYSLPHIEFTGSFVTGNNIAITINNQTLSNVPFNTSNNQTLADIATAIAGLPSVASATPTNPNMIDIVPNLGFYVAVNSINVTGGASQPTLNPMTFNVPGSVSTVAQYLTAIINQIPLVQPVNAVQNGDSVNITSNNTDVPYALNIGTNLNVIARSSPIYFEAQNYGPVPAPVNTLTEIITPLSGWNAINNPKAGVTGRLVETDAELRIRRRNSIRLLGAATVEAIRARLLQEVVGVTSAFVFENVSVVQEPIATIFAIAFTGGDSIITTLNSRILATIPFNTNQLITMTDLANLLKAQPEIADATIGGTGNQTITVEMNPFYFVEIEFQVNPVDINYIQRGGRPPKSFEAVVEGGSDDDIALKIWQTKPAGIQTFGNTSIVIEDSQGESQTINFSRPTPIYLWATVSLTLYSEEVFPPNGQELVKAAILNYGNSLGIGVDVLFQRVLAQIFSVPGISSGNLQIASTNAATDTPSYGTADISIAENEVSLWDLVRITVTI